jgi:hypothetical protein
MSPVVALLSSTDDPCTTGDIITASAFIATISLVVTSALNISAMFFSFGRRSERHYNYSAKYADLGIRIKTELARSSGFRAPVDRFATTVQQEFNQLKSSEPVIPLDCSKKVKKVRESSFDLVV